MISVIDVMQNHYYVLTKIYTLHYSLQGLSK